MHNQNICVFCSSSSILPTEYYTLAQELGAAIGNKNYNLVYGGTDVGMMNSVAEATAANGGQVIGVIPEVIINMNVASSSCHQLHTTKTMAQRKEKMAEISNAFIALPGGFGTLEEISEVITAKHLATHNKAIVLLNHNGFYNHLLDWFERLYTEKFANSSYQSSFFVANTVEQALHYIQNYKGANNTNKYHTLSE